MRNFILFLLIFIGAGCVTVSEHVQSVSTAKSIEKKILNIDQVQIGMKMNIVKAILGDSVVIGYKRSAVADNAYEEIVLSNPYRIEDFLKNGLEYSVLYYFVGVAKPDGMISEDELEPLVFEGDTLIGKGWDFLYSIKKP